MIETLLLVLVVVAIVALVASMLPIDGRGKGVLWLLVLVILIVYLFRGL